MLAYLMTTLRVSFCAGTAVLTNLFRCWALVACAGLIVGVFAATEQAPETLFGAGETTLRLLLFWLCSALLTAQATLTASSTLLEVDLGDRTERFGARYATSLIGILFTFIIPVALEVFLQTQGLSLGDQADEAKALGYFLIANGAFVIPVLQERSNDDDVILASAMPGVVVASSIYMFTASLALAAAALSLTLGIVDWIKSAEMQDREMQRIKLALYSGVMILIGVFIARDPVSRAGVMGSASVLVISLGLWLGIVATVIVLAPKLPRIISGIITTAVLVLFFSGPFNERPIRILPATESPDLVKSSTAATPNSLANYTQRWLAIRKEQIVETPPGSPYPIVIISADGGGIRAAYWTAAVLGRLFDAAPSAGEHMFAISGVSGGALGMTVATGLLKEREAGTLKPLGDATSIELEKIGGTILSADFLAPPLAAMLIADVTRSITHTEWLMDRSTAIERTFERAWQEVTGSNTLEQPFTDLCSDDKTRLPLPYFNGSDALTGERLVLSCYDLPEVAHEVRPLRPFLSPATVRLSTAVMMSARFPLVSPVGSILPAQPGGETLYVVDGGYSDNSGAATLRTTIVTLLEQAKALGIEQSKIQIIYLHLANDPGPSSITATSGPPQSVLGSLVSSVATLEKTRQRVAKRFRDDLKLLIADHNGESLQVNLTREKAVFPLGWMLSPLARAAIHKQIEQLVADSKSDLSRLVTKLATSESP